MSGIEEASAAFRGELLAYSYRILGSWDDAEDAVQETYLRAWRARDSFEERASLRTWLYRIATNVCLNAARDRSRRALPSGIGTPDATVDGVDILPPERWIQPFPSDRDDLRLALVAGMQVLPASQRAVLVLREVLGFSAAEVAHMLDISVAAVKSRLQRARASIAAACPARDDVVEPHSGPARRLLEIYVSAFESGNVDALLSAMRADATLELLPSRTWYSGKVSCAGVLTPAVGTAGDWKMVPTAANGQPAVLAYLHGEPLGVAVLDVREDGIAGITVFGEPGLVQRFTTADAVALAWRSESAIARVSNLP